ncbi:hypothetical protein A5819_003705 [Enterococcus sp. 7E2_DIV0204]|nr:hypothetical protein A5819_003705 [Enterococcus sp. 7E2_DIV0204]OTP47551.1 hypothetical protein A5884_003522 [Enterococcus sp. 7D2_DIV0200]
MVSAPKNVQFEFLKYVEKSKILVMALLIVSQSQ